MEASLMVIIIDEINNQDTVNNSSFMGTFSEKQRMKKFGQKGYKETYDEIMHLRQMKCFKPTKVVYLNPIERKMES